MPETDLIRKLQLKQGQRAAILNAPVGYLDELGTLPDGVELVHALSGDFDWIQIFVKSRAELGVQAPPAIAALKPRSLLWISFPKGTSQIQTDLTRDVGWDAVQATDLKLVNLISVNVTWSAFALRPYLPGEKR